MSAAYGMADAMFDAEAMGRAACPRHGVGCGCCVDCGAPEGRHFSYCSEFDPPGGVELFRAAEAEVVRLAAAGHTSDVIDAGTFIDALNEVAHAVDHRTGRIACSNAVVQAVYDDRTEPTKVDGVTSAELLAAYRAVRS